MDGTGVFKWNDGRKYTGEYVDDKKQVNFIYIYILVF